MNNNTKKQPKEKSKEVAFLLALFFGYLGFHRFYLGKIGTGIIWLLTCGAFFVGWGIDVILLMIELLKINSSKKTVAESLDKVKITVTQDDLNFDDVLSRYLHTDHSRVKAIYDYYSYYHAEFECMLKNIPHVSIKLNDDRVIRNPEITSPFEKTSSVTRKTSIKNLSDFVVIDVETTGLKPGGNDIIEVSAIKFCGFEPKAVFSTLLKPRKQIPLSATLINDITDDMVANSPSFSQIKRSLEEFIGNCPIVAHNAEFDIKFLHVSGLEFPNRIKFYDTLELSQKHIKDYEGNRLDSYKLADVCDECNIYFEGAHRSLSDALAAGLLFIEIVKRVYKTDNILNVLYQ